MTFELVLCQFSNRFQWEIFIFGFRSVNRLFKIGILARAAVLEYQTSNIQASFASNPKREYSISFPTFVQQNYDLRKLNRLEKGLS